MKGCARNEVKEKLKYICRGLEWQGNRKEYFDTGWQHWVYLV